MKEPTIILTQEKRSILKPVAYILLKEGYQLIVTEGVMRKHLAVQDRQQIQQAPCLDALSILRFVRSQCNKQEPILIFPSEGVYAL